MIDEGTLEIASTPNPSTRQLAGRRVALFSGNYNYVRDGANLALNRLVNHLQQAGAEVRVYSPTSATPAFEPAGTLVSVPSLAFPGRGEYRLALGLPERIKRDIRHFRPHLVHLSAPDILGAKALAWAQSELGVPVIASLHTLFETYLDYYHLGFLRARIEAYLRNFYRRCNFVLVPNRRLQDEMSPEVPDPRIRLWGRGVDPSQFNPAFRCDEWRRKRGVGPKDIVVLFFGRLVLEKGIDDYAALVGALRGLGLPITPLIVGDGPARDRLERNVPGARFTGQLVGEELSTAVASADIMINPSRTEAFGNVTLEAMASGLPVIAADSASSRNLLTHLESGLICDFADCEAVARSVAPLVASPTLRKQMAQAAVNAAGKHHWDQVLDEVVKVYSEALAVPRWADPEPRLNILSRMNPPQGGKERLPT